MEREGQKAGKIIGKASKEIEGKQPTSYASNNKSLVM